MSHQVVTDQQEAPGVELDLTPEDIVKQVLECKTEAEDDFHDVRELQKELWNLYRNNRVFDDKLEAQGSEDREAKAVAWQSQVFVPKIYGAIKKARSLVRQGAFRRKEFFQLEPVDPEDAKLVPLQQKVCRFFLDSADFKSRALEAVEAAFIMGSCPVKIGWDTQKQVSFEYSTPDKPHRLAPMERDVGFLTVDVVNPDNFFTNELHEFFIEVHRLPLSQVKSLSKGKNPLFDPKVVMEISKAHYSAENSGEEENERRKKLGINDSSNSFRKTVHVMEYWGPLYDRDGELKMTNSRVFMANEQFVLNPHKLDNPYQHGRAPYRILSPVPMPFRKDGFSLMDSVEKLAKAINDLYRMSLDGLAWKLNKMFQVCEEWLVDKDALGHIRPGVPIAITEEAALNGVGAILEARVSDIPSGSFAEQDFLDRAFDNGSGVPSTMMSGPPLKRDITATEIGTSQQESHSLFMDVAEIFDQFICDCVEDTRLLCLQFWRDFENPRFKAVKEMGRQNQKVNGDEPLWFMAKNVDIRCTSLTSFLEKVQSVEGFIRLFEMAMKIPEIRARLPWSVFLVRVIEALKLPEFEELMPNQQLDMTLTQLEQTNYTAELEAKIAQAKFMTMQAEQGMAQMQMPSPEQILEAVAQVLIQAGLAPEQVKAILAAAGKLLTDGNRTGQPTAERQGGPGNPGPGPTAGNQGNAVPA